MRQLVTVLVLLSAFSGCDDKRAESLKALAPAPLPSLAAAKTEPSISDPAQQREQLFHAEAAPVFGLKVPGGALQIKLDGKHVSLANGTLDLSAPEGMTALHQTLAGAKTVLLVPDADTYLAQASGLLAALQDGGLETWLQHPSGKVAYRVVLRDEAAFQEWLDEAKPGKIRIIQRADGYELQTNVGKLAGGDPNGPSVPVRAGRLDIATLRHGLELLKGRFTTTEDSCIVPSFGTELSKIAATLSAYYRAPNTAIFETQCLVYPRPAHRDAG